MELIEDYIALPLMDTESRNTAEFEVKTNDFKFSNRQLVVNPLKELTPFIRYYYENSLAI